MSVQRDDMFDLLSARAWDRLKLPGTLRRFEHPNERYGHYPRFTTWDRADGWTDSNPSSVTVFDPQQSEEDQNLIARYVEWDRGNDYKRIPGFYKSASVKILLEPTLMIRDFLVPRRHFHILLKNLCQSSLSNIFTLDTGSMDDAGSVGFKIFSCGSPKAVFSVQWSHSPPESWSSMLTSYQHVMGMLRQRMA